MRTLAAASLFVFCLMIPGVALANEPVERVRTTVDAVINTLKDEQLRKPGNEEKRRDAIVQALEPAFDFEEMAKRSLAVYWRKRTPQERKEFVELYTDFLENVYISKIEKYENEEISYVGEEIKGKYANVKTEIKYGQGVIPINYRLKNQGGTWEVYDVVIEGVSLINNYRSQFNSIITSSSYEELVSKLRGKVQQRDSGE